MMRRAPLTSLALAAAVLAWPAGARGQAIEVGHVVTCLEAAPSAFAAPVGPPIDLHVHVVLDNVSLEDGRNVMERVRVAYQPMGINVVPSFATAKIEATDSSAMIAELKGLFGGVRPPWAHVVYLIDGEEIDGPVAGQADCIGGVAFEDSAFAVGEHIADSAEIGPLGFFRDLTAKIAAHEVGHLMGAHHHYANCAEGVPDTEQPTDVSPCTLMFNDISLISLRFSTMNSSVVRGHMDVYTEPVTATPPPDGTPVRSPQLTPCDFRAYRDHAGDHAHLYVNNPDDVDLLGGYFRTELRDGKEIVRFRWQLASLDGEFSPGANLVKWGLHIKGPRALHVEARWDGEGAPTAAVLTEEGDHVTDIPATLTPGPEGTVEVELPMAGLGLASKDLRLGLMEGLTDVDRWIDYDTAAPLKETVRPAACVGASSPADAPSGGLPGVAGPAAAAPVVRATLVTRSARRASRRRSLSVRLAATLRDVRLRLTDRRGRTVARGRAVEVAGRRTVRLRASRRLRAGVHTLQVTGRTPAGESVSRRFALRFRR